MSRVPACMMDVKELTDAIISVANPPAIVSVSVILNTDIVNATLIHDNEVKCMFPRLHFHHCIVCCHVDPSVPPDSSIYNVSGTNSTVVTVVLTGLIAVSFLMVIIISVVTMFVVMFTIAVVLMIIGRKRVVHRYEYASWAQEMNESDCSRIKGEHFN
ncbi:hypothetical protein EMCRGX_G011894 [Ephydatia muelleri]